MKFVQSKKFEKRSHQTPERFALLAFFGTFRSYVWCAQTINEMGVILPDDNNPAAAQFPYALVSHFLCLVLKFYFYCFSRIYWNAAAALYAYLFGRLSMFGIDVLGESQLVGYPNLPSLNLEPQFPSVALVSRLCFRCRVLIFFVVALPVLKS